MIEVSKIIINGSQDSYFFEDEISFSWQIVSDCQNTYQTAYRIQIAQTTDFEKILWDSGKMADRTSQFVNADGFYPKNWETYSVRVMIWDNYQRKSLWSQEKSFLYICSEKIPWKAQWVSAPDSLMSGSGGIYIRKKFTIERTIKKAFLLSSAQGIYKPYLDGECISDELFLPGWTAYEKRIQYQIWDITDRLKSKQEHMLGCILTPGWFCGRLGENGKRIYGKQTAWTAQIYICCDEGEDYWITTDEQCVCHKTPLIMADLYDGEIYDARLEVDRWHTDDNDNHCWIRTKTKKAGKEKLCPQKYRGVCRHEKFKGKTFKTPAGEYCIDFGQNMAGVIEFKVNGKKGEKVELTCFETLDKNGNVYTENLRSAKQTITYYCKGKGRESYTSEFSYQGFRYVYVRPQTENTDITDVCAYAVYSDIPFYGTFMCSNDLVNRLIKNIQWSMKSNFVDIPTDCPQRDERLGWTGDAQIFSETAVYLANVYGFFEKWLFDVAAEQYEDGGIPHLVPDILRFEDQSGDWLLSQGTHSAAAWADVIVLVPWRLYLYYGNKKILENFYDHMKRWIDFMWKHSEEYIWNYKLQFGDWLALDAQEGSYFGATPNELTCTAYFAYSTGVFQKIGGILGKKEDSAVYKTLYQSICRAFCQKFLGKDGSLNIKTQTALAMSLHFGLIPEKYIRKNAEELKRQIASAGSHMTTGFMGTPCLLTALSENGFVEDAYRLLLREEYPSWLYQVKKGATTVWEHLDGIKPDGNMWSADMNSFNHYAYGAVASWLFNQAAGIKMIEEKPGFTEFIIEPKLSDKLPKGNAAIETPYGKTEVCWEIKENQRILSICVPVNTSAELLLGQETSICDSGSLCFAEIGGKYRAEVPSGKYAVVFETI